MPEIVFSERRNLHGTIKVMLHYPGASVRNVPEQFARHLTEPDAIGYYFLSRNVMPAPQNCFRMVEAYIAPQYREDYIVDQLFIDALYRTVQLDYQGSDACLAIFTKQIRKSGRRKDKSWRKTNYELVSMWRQFKTRHQNSALFKFWRSHVRTKKEIKKLTEDGYFGAYLIPKFIYEFVRISIPISRVGIPLSEFVEELTPVPPEITATPIDDVFSPELRLTKGWGKITDYDDPRKFLDNVSAHRFKSFNFDELSKIYYSIYAYSPLTRTYEADSTSEKHPTPPPDQDLVVALNWSIRQNSEYDHKDDWNTLVAAFDAIPGFDFGPGFDVSIDWTRAHNMMGWAKYSRVYSPKGKWHDMLDAKKYRYDRFYLDNRLGFIISRNGKPLLVIGFAIASNKRLLISQIQLVNKRGNKWLFKLPHHYFDYALLKMEEAFPDFDMYFVDGESLADVIRSNYDSKSPMDPDNYSYVIKTYNRPLQLFERVGEKQYIGKYNYYLLEPRDG